MIQMIRQMLDRWMDDRRTDRQVQRQMIHLCIDTQLDISICTLSLSILLSSFFPHVGTYISGCLMFMTQSHLLTPLFKTFYTLTNIWFEWNISVSEILCLRYVDLLMSLRVSERICFHTPCPQATSGERNCDG